MQTNRDQERLNPLPGRVGNLKISKTVSFSRTATAVDYTTADEYRVGVTDTSVIRTITLSTDNLLAKVDKQIKDESGGASTNQIDIVGEGGALIDGVSTVKINVDYGDMNLYSEGTQWFTHT